MNIATVTTDRITVLSLVDDVIMLQVASTALFSKAKETEREPCRDRGLLKSALRVWKNIFQICIKESKGKR